ncbi:putative RecB family nuclease [Bradyrhizobium sp. LB7.2]
MEARVITASVLYNWVECPQRVANDAYCDPSARDEISPFVRMLWERGTLFERETVTALRQPFVDLSDVREPDRERLTLIAMAKGEPLIYGGSIRAGDLFGKPDLIRKEPDGYVPGDIKSGRGKEGGDERHEGRPKRHYAVQLALYVDILERCGFSDGRRAFVLDIRGDQIVYDFGDPPGRDLWRGYEKALAEARSILAREKVPRAAYSSACKLCHWYHFCVRELTAADDLTLIPGLRRSDRDALIEQVPTIASFASINPERFIKRGRTEFRGMGADRFRALQARAAMLKAPFPRPYLRQPISLGYFSTELFFDIEVDPLRDVCYLHGCVERKYGDNETERYVAFFADEATPAAERRAFAAALDYFAARPAAGIYYYSKYERTIYRKLQEKYPDLCTREDVEQLFAPDRAVDLYADVVLKATEWPTRDHSIKTLARYLGFAWRDTHPSGAASVEWADRWWRERNPSIRQRILDYNEDDCRATRILLDGIRNLAA